MARISLERREPKKEIFMSQKTIENLFNNTLIFDFFDTLKKVIDEGYTLIFESYGGDDNHTRIQDANHLKNYINNIQGAKVLS